MASPEFLRPSDRILIVDDFLATGQTISALVRLVEKAGAKLVGIGTLIEKRLGGAGPVGGVGRPHRIPGGHRRHVQWPHRLRGVRTTD